MNITEQVATFIVTTPAGAPPEAALTAAKRALTDTIGVALAGSQEATGRLVLAMVQEEGGREEATVLGTAFRTSASNAALVNGTFAHALDYDDVVFSAHPSSPVMPVVLALGEKLEASGRAVLDAFLIGTEVECRLTRAMGPSHYGRGWHATSTTGTLGATAAAARMLGLNVEATRHALGIATSMASGSRQNFGTMTKPFHAGLAARNGLSAALLAQRGFTGDRDILDAPLGFGGIFCPDPTDYHPERIVEELGTRWSILTPGFRAKRYPCCAATHRVLDAIALGLGGRRLREEEVTQIEVRVGLGTLRPLIRHRPKTGLEGKFSMEYCVAAAILDGGVTLETFTEERVLRPEAQRLLERVRILEGPAEATRDGATPATVTIETSHGKRLVAQAPSAPTSGVGPLEPEEVIEKFRECAARALPGDQVEQALRLLGELDSVANVRTLMAQLRRQAVAVS
jgi:2-methylcitrate dehydratase PrpD